MRGGTEAFPDLGKHCQHPECNQLDFLPFKCDSCRKTFCLEHRSHRSHDCPKSENRSRRVSICETCSASIEVTGCDDGEEKAAMERHQSSGTCDPAQKKKPICPVRRCKAVLTFSNCSACKTCRLKVCLRHRFPADHACNKIPAASPAMAKAAAVGGGPGERFLAALAAREGRDCAKEERRPASPPSTPHTVKAC